MQKEQCSRRGAVKRGVAMLLCVLMMCSICAIGAFSAETRSIRVGVFPYEEQLLMDKNGNYSGYGYDYLQELAKYSAWRYTFVEASWEDCLAMLKAGELDLMGAVMSSPEREAWFEFSDYPMISGYGVLATPLDNRVIAYEDFQAFGSLRVGVQSGNAHLDNFLTYSRVHNFTPRIQKYPTQRALDAALETGEIDALISSNLLRSDTLRVVATFGENDGYFATTKGNTVVLSQLNEAMRQIRLRDPYFNSRINQKYYDLQTMTPVSYTREELDFIDRCPPLNCTYIPEAYPVNYYDADTGAVRGVAVDVCDLLAQRTGLSFIWSPSATGDAAIAQLHSGEAMLIPAKYNNFNWAGRNDATLTTPYLQGQMVMITSNPGTQPEVVALYDQGAQGQITANWVSDGAQFKQYDTILQCVDAVWQGEANATFVTSAIASYLLNDPKYSRLHSTPLYGESADVAMAVSPLADPLLLAVINKGLRNISATQINEIVLAQSKYSRAGPVATYFYLHSVQIILALSAFFLLLLCTLALSLRIRLKSAKALQQALYIDPLTGDPNYQALCREADDLITGGRDRYAIAYLDIQQFKAINDTLGYETGDRVLIATAAVLRGFVGKNERFARIYADVFALLLVYKNQEALQERLEDLSRRLEKLPLDTDAIRPLFCGGVYLLSEEADSFEKACDRANYAKDSIMQQFSNTFAFYDDTMRRRVHTEKELEASMQGALERGEFVAHYQPKVDVITGKVVGAEALVRWQHPEKGLLLPGAFLPFYERIGFIVKIDFAIFEQVCRDIQQWLMQGNQAVVTSVNFSRRHLSDHSLPRRLKQIAQRYEIPPELLEIEVTETEELESVESAVGFVEALKEQGFQVSIDDYGTGYSSISFLQQFPLDALKLDRQFVLNAMKTNKARDIMRNLVAAMRQNGIRVVCEGVETREQRDFVLGLNCRFVQGYFYSTALPRAEFERYLCTHGTGTASSSDFLSIVDADELHWGDMGDLLTGSMFSWIVALRVEPGYPVAYISPAFLAGMGYSQVEFQLATDGLYTGWVHPDDLHRGLEQLVQNEERSEELVLQYRLRKKDGSYVWIREANNRVLTKTGKEMLLSVCTDVSDVVELQAEKGRLLDAIPGGVATLLLTAEGPIIQQGTDRFYTVLGHTREEMDALGNNLQRILYRKDVDTAERMLQRFLQDETDAFESTFRIEKDEGLHWVTFRGSMVHTEQGRKVTVVVFNNDKEVLAKQAAEMGRAKLALAINLTGQAVFEYDVRSSTVLSHTGFETYGVTDGTILRVPEDLMQNDFLHPDDMEKVRSGQEQIREGKEYISYEVRIRKNIAEPEAPHVWIRVTLQTMFNEDRQPERVVGVVENIMNQKCFEHDFLNEVQYRKAFTESSLMAYEMNLTQNTIHRITGSRGFRLQSICAQLEHPDHYDEVLMSTVGPLVSKKDRERFIEEMSRNSLLALYRSGVTEKEIEYRRITPEGTELWNAGLVYLTLDPLAGDVMGYAYHRDIHERKVAERELMKQATRDPLTGTYNRATAEQLIESHLRSDNPHNRVQAFLMLDMDHFKEINDTCGHLTGDQCLIQLVRVIERHLRGDNLVARVGGDEFAVLLKNLPDEAAAVTIARRLARAIAEIGPELKMSLPTSVSIGIALSPFHGNSFEQLYSRADQAMYQAKRQVDGDVVVSDEGLEE